MSDGENNGGNDGNDKNESPDNIFAIQGNGQKDQLAENVRFLQQNFDHILKMQMFRARLQRQYFNSLKEEGFTEEQALDMVKNQSVFGVG